MGNVHFIKLPFGDNLISDLLSKLYETRMLSLIVEGGAALLNSFIRLGLWDEARVFTGPKKLIEGLTAPEIRDIEPSIRSQMGDDLLQVYVNPTGRFTYVQGMGL